MLCVIDEKRAHPLSLGKSCSRTVTTKRTEITVMMSSAVSDQSEESAHESQLDYRLFIDRIFGFRPSGSTGRRISEESMMSGCD